MLAKNYQFTFYSFISILFSTSAFLLIHLINNQILCLFLSSRNICHIQALLSVEYCNGVETNWTEGSLLLIHTFPYLVFLFAGIYIPHYLNTGKVVVNLLISWMCLHMVLLFTGSLVSGFFEYEGLGIPLTWFFVNNAFRITGIVVLIILIGYSIRRFGWYFTKSVPNKIVLENVDDISKWLKFSLVLPFFISAIIVITFTPVQLLLNHTIGFAIGLLYLPVILGTVTRLYLHYKS